MTMRAPVFRLSSLLTCRGLPNVMAGLRQELKGRVLLLPKELGQQELDAVADALALFLGWPVRGVGRIEDLGQQEGPALLWLTRLVRDAPPAVPGSVVVAVRAWLPDQRARLDMPQELLLLRDAIAECLRHEREAGALAALPSWIGRAADTPATAVDFVCGARQHHLEAPGADAAVLFCAGLARVVSGMLSRLPEDEAVDLVRWACGAGPPTIPLLVSFESGMLHRWHGQTEKTLRRPLALLGRLEQAPGRPSLHLLVSFFQGEAWHVYHALSLHLASRSRPSRLGPPRGREDYVAAGALHAFADPDIFLPAAGPVGVYGPAGCGKTELAVHVATRIAHRLPVLWTSFAAGPELGWLPIAQELGVALADGGEADDAVPGWVEAAQAALARRPVLLIVDDAPDEGLEPWLPADPVVAPLILLESPSGDAYYALGPLGVEQSLQMITSGHPPDVRERYAPLVERAGGHPQTLRLLKALLIRYWHAEPGTPVPPYSTPDTIAAFLDAQASQSVGATQAGVLRAVLRMSTSLLSQPARQVLAALTVAVPTGSPRALLPAAAGLTDAEAERALAELDELALLRHGPDPVALHSIVRRFWEEALREACDDLREPVRRHCAAVLTLVPAANEVSCQLYAELIWAARQARNLASLDDEQAAADGLALVACLRSLSDWRRRFSLEQALETAQAAHDQGERLHGTPLEAATAAIHDILSAYTELLTTAAAKNPPPDA